MTPRLFIVILLAVLLLVWLLDEATEEPVESTTVKTVEWPVIVPDPSPAYAHVAFLTALKPAPRPRARTAPIRTASVGAPVIAAGTVNGYPCGGDLPPCYVLARESGGNPTAQNPRSTASGLWQFLDSTWANYGGYAKARYAPPDVQNEKARLVWAGGRGCSHWFACR